MRYYSPQNVFGPYDFIGHTHLLIWPNLSLTQIHDNAGLLELSSEREADVRRAGGESRPDTVGDGQPGVRRLWAAAVGHAAHQPGVVRREHPGQFRRVNGRRVAADRVNATPASEGVRFGLSDAYPLPAVLTRDDWRSEINTYCFFCAVVSTHGIYFFFFKDTVPPFLFKMYRLRRYRFSIRKWKYNSFSAAID